MEVNCSFKEYSNNGYVCNVSNTTLENPQIKINFKGVHAIGKRNNDVSGFIAQLPPASSAFMIPRDLSSSFPNLVSLLIVHCNLQNISLDDLKDHKNLRFLDLRENKLKSLPDNLFVNTPKLEIIHFTNNLIEECSSKLFDPLSKKKLVVVSFLGNPLINLCYNKWSNICTSPLETLLQKIDMNCKPPPTASMKKEDRGLQPVLMKCEEFYKTGVFSDLTFEVDGKTFKVHRCILAAQSSVFERMLTSDDQDLQVKTEIKSCSKESFEGFLLFFYTGEIKPEANVMKVFKLAVEFDVPTLKSKCEEKCLAELKESNMLEVYNLGNEHESGELKQAAFGMMKRIFPEISDASINNSQLINQLVKAKRNLDNLLDEAKNFKGCKLK